MCWKPQNCPAGQEEKGAQGKDQGCAKGISFPLLCCPEGPWDQDSQHTKAEKEQEAIFIGISRKEDF